jgi:hypothetical protein
MNTMRARPYAMSSPSRNARHTALCAPGGCMSMSGCSCRYRSSLVSWSGGPGGTSCTGQYRYPVNRQRNGFPRNHMPLAAAGRAPRGRVTACPQTGGNHTKAPQTRHAGQPAKRAHTPNPRGPLLPRPRHPNRLAAGNCNSPRGPGFHPSRRHRVRVAEPLVEFGHRLVHRCYFRAGCTASELGAQLAGWAQGSIWATSRSIRAAAVRSPWLAPLRITATATPESMSA